MTPSTNRNDSRPPPDRRKAVLFCPACGHESPITGDWLTTTRHGDRLLVCTVCDAVVDRRRPGAPVSIEAT